MNELDKLNDKLIKILEEKIVLLEDMNVRLRFEKKPEIINGAFQPNK